MRSAYCNGESCGERPCRSGLWLMMPAMSTFCENCLTHLGLWQVGHHDHGVLPALGHLVQVVEYAVVALLETHALREEHRGVAMGVEGEDALVQLLGHVEVVGLVHQPAEQGLSLLPHPFGVPLHTHDGFELGTRDGLDDTVGRRRRHAEARARLRHA